MRRSDAVASRPVAQNDGLYRAVWRWHFYAGLLVLPVLAWLAVTGSIYLYKPEIERWLYADWIHVAPRAAPLSLGDLVRRVSHETGATVTQIARPAAGDESWRLTLARHDGAMRTAFVDPYSARLLGTTSQGGAMQTVRSLHSLIITGPIGNAVIEISAGWTILLVLSGLYLWWPRRGNPALALRSTPRRRLFWRDLHASTGVVAAAVILFLATTGMPWSGVWGKAAQGWVASHGLGRPAAPGGGVHAGHDAAATLPWSMQRSDMPHAMHSGDSGPDRALAASGLAAPWTLTMPAAGAPYLIATTAERAEDAHVVYVDPASGRVLQDARATGFGAGARWIEWGIMTHQGQEYGEPNRLLMLAGCICVLLLAISAPVMWWKRRPAGRIAAPPPSDPRSARVVLGMMIVGGMLFPLTGLSMLAALAIEGMMRHRERLATA